MLNHLQIKVAFRKLFTCLLMLSLTTCLIATNTCGADEKVTAGKGNSNAYKKLWEWSESINNPSYFNEPHCIHLDSDGNLIIADMNNARVMRFTPKGKFLGEIGKGSGNEYGYFTKPRDVDIAPNGDIVTTDQKPGKNRVQVFSPQGEYRFSFGPEGKADGQIDWPHGLAFDSEGNIYVTNVSGQCVYKYAPSGEFLFSIGSNSPNKDVLTLPHGLTITPNDAVFVSDYYGTIQKYDRDGNYQMAFRNVVHNKGSAFVHTINSDSKGNVYLMVRGIKDFVGTYEESPVENRSFYIVKYTNNGDHLATIQISDKGREVIHCCIDADGTIYALFKGNGRMGVEVLQGKRKK